ncbi:MAG: hypothetical protein JKY44_02235 [Flavobacteriaceae bacterium]|nr:hypothetical protein [Flavobacteriaceae bacterium]
MKNRTLKTICGILALIVIGSLLVVFFIPNFQFRTYEMNRTYGVTFGILSFILFLLLFWAIKDIQAKEIKPLLYFMNGFMLVFAIGNLVVYSKKIDPDIQFKDYEILYVNKLNPREKIISQYDVNWKTNEKEFQNNHVVDIGIFRLYKSYGIDTLSLKQKWKKKTLHNNVYKNRYL